MQDGKALQAGTSHDLGQNFGKAFDVKFQNADKELEYVWQTSWGVSTRLIGGLVMTHSDDAGLVLPPQLAPIHVAIVPIYRKDEEREAVCDKAEALAGRAARRGAEPWRWTTARSYKPGAKYFHWEQRGVPVRVEIGPRDIRRRRGDDQAPRRRRQAEGPHGRAHRHPDGADGDDAGRAARRGATAHGRQHRAGGAYDEFGR